MARQSEIVWFADLTHRSLLCVWSRSEGGYRWVDGYHRLDDDRDPGPWLVSEGAHIRRYGPLGRPRLYRAFAKIDNPDDAMKFASSYGRLTKGELIHPAGGGNGVIGESFALWQHEARNMRFLVQIWDWVKTKNGRELAPYIWWEQEPRRVCIRFVCVAGELSERTSARAKTTLKRGEPVAVASTDPSFPRQQLRGTPITDPAVLKTWAFGDVLGPAWDYLCGEVNKKLEGHLSPQLLPRRRDSLSFKADSLLTALYLQLQLDMAGAADAARGCKTAGCTEEANGRKSYCDDCQRERTRDRKLRSYHKNKAHWPSTSRKPVADGTPISTPEPADDDASGGTGWTVAP